MTNERKEMMVKFIQERGAEHLVRELNYDGKNFEGALEWTYDSMTMSKEEFKNKYFG